MNLAISINKAFLDLPPDVSIPLEFNGPLFITGDEIKGNHSYPFTFKNIPQNQKVFDFPHRIALNNTVRIYDDCEIFYSGNRILAGSFSLLKAGDEDYEGVFLANGVTSSLVDKRLADFEYGGPHTHVGIPWLTYLSSVNNSGYPTYPFAFPYWYTQLLYGASYEFTEYGVYPKEISAMPYVKAVLDYQASELAFRLDGSFMTDAEMDELVFFGISRNESTIIIKDLLPDLMATDLFKALRQFFGVIPIPSLTERKITLSFAKDLLATTDEVDYTYKVIAGSFEKQRAENPGFRLQVADMVQNNIEKTNIDFSRLIGITDDEASAPAATSLAEGDIYYFRSDNSFYVAKTEDSLSTRTWYLIGPNLVVETPDGANVIAPVADYATLPAGVDEDIALVQDENWFYIKRSIGWMKYSYNMPEYVVGDGSTGIKPLIGTLPMDVANTFPVTVGPYYKALYPTLHIKPNNQYAGYSNEIPPAFLFYRGIQLDENANDYPLASSDIYDFAGTQIGNYALRYDGTNGLFEKFLKNWFLFLKDIQDVRCTAKMDLADIMNLDLSKKIRIRDSLFFIKKINVTLTANEISDANFDLAKIKY